MHLKASSKFGPVLFSSSYQPNNKQERVSSEQSQSSFVRATLTTHGSFAGNWKENKTWQYVEADTQPIQPTRPFNNRQHGRDVDENHARACVHGSRRREHGAVRSACSPTDRAISSAEHRRRCREVAVGTIPVTLYLPC